MLRVVAVSEMNSDQHHNCGDGDETERAAKRAEIGKRSAHQWNICAEPG